MLDIISKVFHQIFENQTSAEGDDPDSHEKPNQIVKPVPNTHVDPLDLLFCVPREGLGGASSRVVVSEAPVILAAFLIEVVRVVHGVVHRIALVSRRVVVNKSPLQLRIIIWTKAHLEVREAKHAGNRGGLDLEVLEL